MTLKKAVENSTSVPLITFFYYYLKSTFQIGTSPHLSLSYILLNQYSVFFSRMSDYISKIYNGFRVNCSLSDTLF
ncbi:hypothetical protein BpHYR1_022299 [Brachionus plicatilis]|uniref:Uncharacterized protein n=1 Tax=Brachionus plicatilis TaxID=10195 RepID=A0A3M7PEX2_BRAPC|nr:hypothetical protein BpHYR1_022299 [Brachionus plicatilis]